MGLITTMGKFCYIECDMLNCSKKIEKSGENLLKELAVLCGWESRGTQWICPSCVEKDRSKKTAKRVTKAKRRPQATL
jgi:hypothetical protein